MPLHFDSITNDGAMEAFSNIVSTVFDSCDSVFAASDKRHFIARSDMVDIKTGDIIGNYVFTIFCNEAEQTNELLDVDITFHSYTPTKLHFIKKLEGSSDANEYYEVETVDTEQHLEIETVNRYTVDGDIVDKNLPAYISVFPFELSVYKNIDVFNRKIGFKKRHPIGKTGLTTAGLSETFISPGSVMGAKDKNEHFSFLIGTIVTLRDVCINIGGLKYDFVLAQVKTALGSVPVVMGRKVFDIRKARIGSIVAMRADVKADLSKTEDWIKE